MADILIKNMEMPKEGRLVLAICPDGAVYEYFGDKNKYGGYRIDSAQKYLAKSTAVALPEHCDLIQRDNLYEFIEKNEEVTVGEIYDFIQDAPVIVEATE